ALGAPDRHPGESVLEDLLEAQELNDPEVDRRVEAQPSFVRAQRAVELHPEAPVDVDLARVVLPRDAEDDLPLGLADALGQLGLDELGVLGQSWTERVEHLTNGLVELDLPRVAGQDLRQDRLELLVDQHPGTVPGGPRPQAAGATA